MVVAVINKLMAAEVASFKGASKSYAGSK